MLSIHSKCLVQSGFPVFTVVHILCLTKLKKKKVIRELLTKCFNFFLIAEKNRRTQEPEKENLLISLRIPTKNKLTILLLVFTD